MNTAKTITQYKDSQHNCDEKRFFQKNIEIADTINKKSTGFKRIRKNARFIAWCYLNRTHLQSLLNTFSTPELKSILVLHPHIIKKPFKPYICVNWKKKQRINSVTQHFSFMSDLFSNNLPLIYRDEGYCLLEIQDRDEEKYQLILNRGQNREGALGLQLINSKNQRIYTITMNLCPENYGSMYIGSIQGPNNDIENRSDIIKSLTKGCHGLRPKALILEFAIMLAHSLKLQNIYGISNKSHMYQSWRYIGRKRNAVTFDYDSHWQEYGAIKSSNKDFYNIPLEVPKKDLESLNRNKRKLYKKRYQWLEDLEMEFNDNLSKITTASI
ncbi:VirK/YbjX family protein [Photobacterium leiognathi]|uniref:VirK/YbjX family protein n=1 Tax=Photobacterium leiognathi TaxID=553611 RepID=UPI0029811DF1|nr:VirK/YbjX family protein [Photobacterium leiognathi]